MLEKSKFGVEGENEWIVSEEDLDKIEEKLKQDQEGDVVWLHVYRTIS